ncbi:hypothetical protein Pcinc_008833 [Petrolisthes cinctipes]|uniref:Uncharacterized protein n=1 Tax=Petrolisthes cinctipes TaxID=88211 RepID=A0AAE1G5V0_PETCI|nr:hypothetical protein Pcinc_008826 [Petrolisthes cinctipes]KAK3887068.1 hypothetical protein Pcinc_008833 [Petrolisthes cinctipes]
MIHKEIMESKEREKRINSVVIRGLGTEVTTLQAKFDEVVTVILPNKQIQLQEIVPIRPNLVRAKITDFSLRCDLLNASKNLRDSTFPRIYINRDLTFKQRELIKKRSTIPNNQTTHPQPGTREPTFPSLPTLLPSTLAPFLPAPTMISQPASPQIPQPALPVSIPNLSTNPPPGKN